MARSLRGLVTHAADACADIVFGAATLGVDMPLLAGLAALCAIARRCAAFACRRGAPAAPRTTSSSRKGTPS